jgi:hypothetical protein
VRPPIKKPLSAASLTARVAPQYGHVSRVQLLIERGADSKIEDDLYHGDAGAGANYFGQIAVQNYLRSLKIRICRLGRRWLTSLVMDRKV